MRILLTITALLMVCFAKAQHLQIIEQDYTKALKVAKNEDKMIFIDFYTTWCSPCKKLDKLIFQNDSIQSILSEDFVLLRYNAEDDKVYHLSKKHHVSSYPTAVVLNQEGYVVNRKYGFPGENFHNLSASVINFAEESILLDSENKIIKGYSNQIDMPNYPKFYVDYINRDNIKVVDTKSFNSYWNAVENPISEEFFSTLLYFASDVPDAVANLALNYKDDYFELYGKLDTEILFYFLSAGKLNKAISAKSQSEFEDAKTYAYQTLTKEWTDDIIPNFEVKFLKAQNKWDEVYNYYENLKEKGKLNNGAINQFCWEVYEKCDDQEVIRRCIDWMGEVTQKDTDYAYLDTYAYLCVKSGDRQKAREIAELAVKIGKQQNVKTTNMEDLLNKL
ncbi:thioredoxin family protein [Flavobacterium sp. CBA20B-1]|uniref:thioredoxin family protein n=1 Tax=unclassified Flavobacterium TaxID=196869 RepID=UPI0022247D21|nr:MULTISPECIES: thioredoxin family protein [unclassified Flavobacterium]WCM41914.1 thioredoxin family protein [Flavobacterium sp. CBA20B-1]